MYSSEPLISTSGFCLLDRKQGTPCFLLVLSSFSFNTSSFISDIISDPFVVYLDLRTKYGSKYFRWSPIVLFILQLILPQFEILNYFLVYAWLHIYQYHSVLINEIFVSSS